MKYFLIGILVLAFIGTGWWIYMRSTSEIEVSNPNVIPEWADLYEVQNGSDLSQIENQTKEVFSNFVTTNSGNYGWQSFAVANKQVPVEVGLTALGVKVPEEIERRLNVADWGIRSCESTKENPKFILRLMFAPNADGTYVPYAQKQTLLKNWENSLLSDVKAVLFPSPYYETNALSISNSYTDEAGFEVTYIRQTDVMNGASLISDFGYMIVSEHVLIGTDFECMDEFAAEVLGVDRQGS